MTSLTRDHIIRLHTLQHIKCHNDKETKYLNSYNIAVLSCLLLIRQFPLYTEHSTGFVYVV